MTGISALSSMAADSARTTTDRTTVAIGRALQEKKKEAAAMVRLIEAASTGGKGQHVDYRA